MSGTMTEALQPITQKTAEDQRCLVRGPGCCPQSLIPPEDEVKVLALR